MGMLKIVPRQQSKDSIYGITDICPFQGVSTSLKQVVRIIFTFSTLHWQTDHRHLSQASYQQGVQPLT